MSDNTISYGDCDFVSGTKQRNKECVMLKGYLRLYKGFARALLLACLQRPQ